MQGDALFQIQFLLLLAHRGVETGPDHAWSDAIDADIVIGAFARQSPGEMRNRTFDHLVRDIRVHGA